MFNRGIKASAVAAATEEEVMALSTRLNVRLCQMVEPPATPSWFKLFRAVDDDGSGHISYSELHKMVREQLRMTPDDMPTVRLHSLWAALDTDHSGLVSVEEVRRART